MSHSLRSVEVFTPNEFPAWTYVEREQDFEKQVMNGLRTPNIIISVSGPSKSGKSVLLQKVVGKDSLIRIFGPQIKAADDVWDAVLDWMGSPASSTGQMTTTATTSTAIGGQASFNLRGFFSLGGKSDTSDSSATTDGRTATHVRAGLKQG